MNVGVSMILNRIFYIDRKRYDMHKKNNNIVPYVQGIFIKH